MKTLSIILLALVASPACSKKTDNTERGGNAPKSSEPAAPPVDDKLAAALPAKAPAAFSTWDLPARAKAWQGARVTEQSLGFSIALEVKGASATIWDGKVEKQLGFALESPCSAKLVEHGADGSSSSTTTHFTIKNGALVEGLGDAGSRKGKAAVACISNQVLTLDDAGTCLAWSSMFDDWKSGPATCGFTQKDGKDVFTANVNGRDTSLVVDGDALLSEQLVQKSSVSFPDFAAAKAARDKR
jgi:hypothetical protein